MNWIWREPNPHGSLRTQISLYLLWSIRRIFPSKSMAHWLRAHVANVTFLPILFRFLNPLHNDTSLAIHHPSACTDRSPEVQSSWSAVNKEQFLKYINKICDRIWNKIFISTTQNITVLQVLQVLYKSWINFRAVQGKTTMAHNHIISLIRACRELHADVYDYTYSAYVSPTTAGKGYSFDSLLSLTNWRQARPE